MLKKIVQGTCRHSGRFLLASIVLLGCKTLVQAGDVYVSRLGASTGWYSDDTRSAAGVPLLGLVSTVPSPVTGTTGYTEAGDAAIADQIKFGDFYADSHFGVLSLDGTISNSGKSSVKRYGISVLAAELSEVTAAYRWYMDPYTTTRTPALGIIVVGTDGKAYSLSYVGAGSAPGWNNFTLDASSVGWRIYGNGAPGGLMPAVSMTDLLTYPTFGPLIQGGTVVAVGFNIGSSQRNCRVGFDWLECSLLEGGDRIQFVEDIDSDNDGLLDANESDIGTDPNNADTDSDGVTDGVEVNDLGSDPLDSDTDDDTLSDGEEVELGTSPIDADTDGDSFDDALEVNVFSSDPTDATDPLDIGNGTINEALGVEAAQIGAGILSLNLDLFIETRGAPPAGGVKLSLAKNAKAAEGRRTSLANRMSEVSKALIAGDYLTAELAIESLMGKIDNSTSGEPDWIKPSTQKDALYQSLVELKFYINYFGNN
jgi:hypothetical protein